MDGTNIGKNIYTLDYVVKSCLADIGEPDASPLYMQLLKWANDGYRRLNLAGLMPIAMKSANLDVDPFTNTAVLPDDYVSYLKIGICCNGVLINFSAADNLCMRDDSISMCKCDDDIPGLIDQCCSGNLIVAESGISAVQPSQNYWAGVSWFYPYYSHYHNGQFMAGYYGLGAGFNNYGFKINQQTNRIQFASCVRLQTVVLEYISSGLSSSGDAFIEQTTIPVLQAFIHKQRCAFSSKREDKQMYPVFANQFRVEERALNSRQNALTVTEWYTLFRRVSYQTPKR